ncbi:Crp/Fnr family transcriptional regulator [Gymnodinialimonas hymeniacidonis]|uniref:Crp/Fnr family transcriptional regulator n=1 Tax=Gymnodinialimonas hymeniacidonis TaxID=3126508 RepID=UPI0034C68FE4
MVTDCANCPLRKREAYDTLNNEDIAFMRRFKVGELKVDPGTTLLMEGSNSPQLFTVLKGMGLRYKLLPNGRRQVVNFALPGGFLGLQAGVMGEMKHSVEATTPMVLCVFDRAELWNLFKTEPERAFDLTWLSAMDEHFLGEALASVGQMSAIERMCWGLLRFYTRCDDLGLTDGDHCPFPFRQQDLADALGLSLVHTNKTLMKLRDKQILSLEDGMLGLHDREKMEELAMIEIDRPARRPLI